MPVQVIVNWCVSPGSKEDNLKGGGLELKLNFQFKPEIYHAVDDEVVEYSFKRGFCNFLLSQ